MDEPITPSRRQRFKQKISQPFVWLVGLLRRFWQFLGRMGMALRRLLTWFVWKPLFFLTIPFWLPLSWLWQMTRPLIPRIWAFIGRVGLAERELLHRFVLRPLRWAWRLLRRLTTAVSHWLMSRFQARWQATAPQRALWRQRRTSRLRVWRAKVRVLLRRPTPPRTAVLAPHVPLPKTEQTTRPLRLALTVAILTIVSATAILASRPQPVETAVASPATPEKIVVVITPTPGPATPTPRAPLEVKLTPWATPDPLTSGGSIAFTWHQDGNSDIYVLPVGQPEPFRLTSHPAPDRQPAWSADGQSLAFASRRDGNWEIYTYHLPTETLRRITNSADYEGNPNWSPDGQWVVYEGYQNDNLDIYIMRADGSQGPFRITENEARDLDPVWSPDGRHIAFTSWRSGSRDIFVLSLDEVTDEAAINITQTPDRQEDRAAFAPNGRFLAYDDSSGSNPFTYVQPLTTDLRADGAPLLVGQQGADVAWSPDSRSLMVVYAQNGLSYLMGATPAGWGVAPQAFAVAGAIANPSWSGVAVTPQMAELLRDIDEVAQPLTLYKEAPIAPQEEGAPVLLQRISVSAPSPYLSDRVDESFVALRERLLAEAGWDVLGQLDQMFADLDERPLPGQPANSWHQAGRAFDLPYREVLAFEPRLFVVREDVGATTYWRVFVQTAAQDGSQGEPLRALPWDFRARFEGDAQYFDEGGKLMDAIPTGYYVDFTALAADYGWQRVSASDNWRTYFPGIRFWQFEQRQGLLWSEAMLELYTLDELGDRLTQ